MRLTRGADYGARGIIHLAKKPHDAVVLVGDIAAAEGLPESYLAKIFQELAREGIVRSFRGAKGGFSLGRPSDEITLRQVIEAIEGPITLSCCMSSSENCAKIPNCSLHSVLTRAEQDLVAMLEATTFQELALYDRVGNPAAG